jgi:tetratricopeptide (TPR) repeat protein
MEKLEWLDTYLTEAENLIMEGSVNDGLALMQNLLYEEPGYAALHNYLGWAYCYYAESEQKAEVHWKWAIKFDKELAAPYLHLGRYYRGKRKYSDAVKYLEAGLETPDAIREALLENLAHVYELRGDYRKAVETYKSALASCVGYQSEALLEGIKRCRKKKWALLFRTKPVTA